MRAQADELVVLRCWCGIAHAVPSTLRNEQLRQHHDGTGRVMSIFCPLGHEHAPGSTPKHKELEQQLQRERAKHDQTKAALESAKRSRNAVKAAHTRTKNRVAKGVCPCCNRTFQNLHRHMVSQHPDYVSSDDPQ